MLQCLKCPKEPAPGKALCEECYRASHAFYKAQSEAWNTKPGEEKIQKVPPAPDEAEPQPKFTDSSSDEGEIYTPPTHLGRFVAAITDIMSIAVITKAVTLIALALTGLSDDAMRKALHEIGQLSPEAAVGIFRRYLLVTTASLIIPSWLFYVLFECSKFSATPGKMILGITVKKRGGERLDPLNSSVRYLVRSAGIWAIVLAPVLISGYFNGLTIIFAGCIVLAAAAVSLVDPALVFFNKRRHTLHDFAAQTDVIQGQSTGASGLLVSLGIVVIAVVLLAVI